MASYANEGSMGETVSLELELRKNGHLIYEAISNQIVLNSKVQVLNPSQSGIESEVFIDLQTGIFIRNSNSLPQGTYTACITVRNDQVGTNSQDVTACIEFGVEQSSRLRLMHIPDGEEVSGNELPMFSWSFLSSSIRATEVQYTLTVCEILEGQSKEDALLRNMPLLTERGLRTSTFQYPINAQSLKEDKKYAWGVKATVKDLPIATSEVWGFSIERINEKEKKAVSMPYLELDNYRKDEVVKITSAEFNLLLEQGDKKERSLSFDIQDVQGKSLKSSFPEYRSHFGANYISLDLTMVKRLKNGKTYTLIIEGENLGVQQIQFIYIQK